MTSSCSCPHHRVSATVRRGRGALPGVKGDPAVSHTLVSRPSRVGVNGSAGVSQGGYQSGPATAAPAPQPETFTALPAAEQLPADALCDDQCPYCWGPETD
jgi:hypothetical protein